jgi:diguanylate cyclase (GGDEF)-like protein
VLKAVTVFAVMLTYLLLDMALRHQTPPEALPMTVIDGLHYFNVVGAMVILIFLAAYYYHLINRATASLKDMAMTDPLTKLHNRRSLGEVIRREESRHGRHQRPLSFVLMDLDHFKNVNDTLGHDTGDLVLQAVGEALRQGTRDVDFVGRWGGEEFLAVLPDTNEDGAALVAERLRHRVADLSVPGPRGPLNVSVTVGVAQLQAKEPAEHAISRADAALYDGKRQGRNRVCRAPQHLPTDAPGVGGATV